MLAYDVSEWIEKHEAVIVYDADGQVMDLEAA